MPLDRIKSLYHCTRTVSLQRIESADALITVVLLLVLILALLGTPPTLGQSRSWGYGPSGGGVLVILLLLFLSGRIYERVTADRAQPWSAGHLTTQLERVIRGRRERR
jgi:hypothetical protein